MYKVYKLICPILNKVVYIGLTKNELKKRLSEHLRTDNDTKKGVWIKSLRWLNLVPKIELIKSFEVLDDARVFENYWIDFFLNKNKMLFNKNLNKNFKVVSDEYKITQITLSKKIIVVSYGYFLTEKKTIKLRKKLGIIGVGSKKNLAKFLGAQSSDLSYILKTRRVPEKYIDKLNEWVKNN